jgi:acyl-CoA synthetase (AMP-forming)/AMP-acid ligase II
MEPWLSRAARMRPERAALVTPARNWTFEVLYETARGVAGALREQGIGTGDRVGLALAGEQLIVALHGCLLLGAVAVPIDLRLGEAGRRGCAVRRSSCTSCPAAALPSSRASSSRGRLPR